MNRWVRLLTLYSIIPAAWGQSSPVSSPVYFPTLSWGPGAWSILRLTNPASMAKTARVDVYGSDGERVPVEPVYMLPPGASVDVRIDGQTADYESCWARVEDISTRKSKPALEASAREEEIRGNRLEVYTQTVARVARAGRWLASARAAAGRRVFFLNVSDEPTVLKICAIDSARQACNRGSPGTTTVSANARQSVVLDVGRLRRDYLRIESSAQVYAVIGVLRAGTGTSRVFSTETSITFGEPEK